VALGLLVTTAAGAVLWFALGMNRGLLLSSDVKTRFWPWRPHLDRPELQAPALSDPVWQFVPWLVLARRELAEGRLPLWNPHQDCGVPLLGNAQSALASPLLLPPLVLGVENGWNLSLLLRLLVAGAGTFLWLRRAGRSPPASALGAVAFALSGPMVAWLAHPHTLTVAWAPWLLLALDRTQADPVARNAAGVALATGLVLAGGHPESALMLAMLAFAVTTARARSPRQLFVPISGALLGAGLAAPVLAPFVEYFLLSEARLGAGREPFTLPAGALVRFLRPDAPAGHPIEAAATMSLTVLVLALAGALAARRDPRRLGWLAAAGVVLLLAYDNPVARAAAAYTPVYWSRILLLLPLTVAPLAASSVDSLMAGLRRLVSARMVAALALVPAAMAAGELIWAARGVHAVTDPTLVGRSTPLVEHLLADPEPARVLPLHSFLPPNSATVFGLDDVRGYDSLAPAGWRRQREAIGAFAPLAAVSDALEPWEIAPHSDALSRWNVKYLLLHPSFVFDAGTWQRSTGLELAEVYRGPDGTILENLRVMPRVRATSGQATLMDHTTQRWRIMVETPDETEVVVANPWYPGWKLRVDGRPAEMSGRPGAPITVTVPAGRHMLELRYRPLSFTLGVAVAALSLCVLGACAALPAFRRFRDCRGSGRGHCSTRS